ncbi:MAG: ethanolamine utilization protein EutN/carboxysome structural protein CcmL [uncultured bacterium]|nr:MAG: ethanolamine utilization protein EutN/carboxysome structural protein CcmL [uncultured bacterium]
MILGYVKGNVVASAKYPCFEGQRLLIVQPIDEKGDDKGDSFLACDSVQAGPGDVVLVEREGNTARQILGTPDDPFHSVIVGIVDRITTEK